MEAAAELIARARLICGPEHVLTAPAVLSTYRSDGIWRDGPLPVAVVLPGAAAEVAALVRACTETKTPFTVRGAGTSVGAGALPVTDGVVIALTRMRRILEVSREAFEVTAEPGVTLAAIARAIAPDRLEAPDPDPVSTVGGHLAETRGLRGIVGIDLIDADGRLARFDASTVGYDIAGAFAGTRGRGGIAVAITLRTEPSA
jgi:glycolate oxidase